MWSTHILDNARAKKKHEREQLRMQLLAASLQALDKLSQLIQFDQAYVFGSVSRPQGFDEHSDLDIAFAGLQDEDFFTATTIVKEGIPWKKKE